MINGWQQHYYFVGYRDEAIGRLYGYCRSAINSRRNVRFPAIAKEDRLEYFKVLEDCAVEGDRQPFADLVAGLADRQIERCIEFSRKGINPLTMSKAKNRREKR